MEALLRDLNRYVAPSMFISSIYRPHDTLKKAAFERGDLINQQRLDRDFHNIELWHDWSTEVLLRMREVVGQQPF